MVQSRVPTVFYVCQRPLENNLSEITGSKEGSRQEKCFVTPTGRVCRRRQTPRSPVPGYRYSVCKDQTAPTGKVGWLRSSVGKEQTSRTNKIQRQIDPNRSTSLAQPWSLSDSSNVPSYSFLRTSWLTETQWLRKKETKQKKRRRNFFSSFFLLVVGNIFILIL